ncbi:MAG TPA: DinB family protein, partial [Vicinamibacteria bacterium]|nr:DinB family protein [Vicinamibacteria bacterium]
GSPYTIWELLEHIRIAQADIVSFSRSADHQSPPFPEGYWPEDRAPESDEEWQRAREGLKNDLEAMKRLVADPEQDLLAPIPHGDGQTLLREAVLLADHNAYHLGQIVLMLKMLKLW